MSIAIQIIGCDPPAGRPVRLITATETCKGGAAYFPSLTAPSVGSFLRAATSIYQLQVLALVSQRRRESSEKGCTIWQHIQQHKLEQSLDFNKPGS